MIVFNTIVLLLIDFYIYKALRATRIRWVASPLFPKIWWGYSLLLTVCIFVSIYVSIPLMFRSIILVAFFLTFISKFTFILILLADDIRRGGIWLKRVLVPKKKQVAPAEDSDASLPEKRVKGISRSQFLTKAGILVAAAPLAPLGWGVISGAYDYRIRREKLYLPNLPNAFHGMKIGQLSDVHSGSFYNKTAVQGGVDLLLAEKPDLLFFTGDLVNFLAS